jgi:hypothetical protein
MFFLPLCYAEQQLHHSTRFELMQPFTQTCTLLTSSPRYYMTDLVVGETLCSVMVKIEDLKGMHFLALRQKAIECGFHPSLRKKFVPEIFINIKAKKMSRQFRFQTKFNFEGNFKYYKKLQKSKINSLRACSFCY